MRRNLKLTLIFDGSAYHGWQSQKNALAVCDMVTSAIVRLTGEEDIKLYGCSRTDAGVHALMYVASFRTDCAIPSERFPYALNFLLPPDIRATGCEDVPDDFHAQYSCVGKEYIYRMHCLNYNNPFYRDRVYHCKYGDADVELMNDAAKRFIGRHDFSAFMAQGSKVTSTVRTIKYFNVARRTDIIEFTVCADGFLYNMVRILVGTLLDVSRGRITLDDIDSIIESHDRSRAGNTVPSCGLYLNREDYVRDTAPRALSSQVDI